MPKQKHPKQYRNTNDFVIDGQTIDRGSLWNKVGAYLVLVDDDQYVQTLFDETLFEKSE
jgi:hypothetical protein